MKIADIEFPTRPVFLAPMEDVTDPAFRLLCKRFGADLVYTEFVSSEALVRNVNSTLKKLSISQEERPVAIQIYGRDPHVMADAARMCEEAKPDIIDLNFGCPVKKVAGKGAGAGLLQDVPRMLEITKSVVEAVHCPVTVKTRLGWDASKIVIPTLALQLQDCGIKALTIHARTRSQMYTGEADWRYIAEVKNNPHIHIPIIGNGDITTPQETLNAFENYGVDAVMIGRGSIGCPWIFREVKHFLQHQGEKLPPLSFPEALEIMKEMVLTNVRNLDERRGILHIRRHLAASPIFKGIPNFRDTRVAMLRAESVEELFAIMEQVKTMIPTNEGRGGEE